MKPIRPWWYYTILWIARNLFFRLGMGGIRSIDEHNVPREGAVIVSPVHVSFLDPPAVACGTMRRLRFMAKEELFRHWFLGPLIRSLGAFPVRRGEGDTEAIRMAVKCLEAGEAILMFPEGTRGDGITMNPINKGVAMVAKMTGAQVLPVGIVGTHRAWPKGAKKLRRQRTTLIYGKPFTYAEVSQGISDREARDRFAELLEARIIEACEKGGFTVKSARSSQGPTRSDLVGESTAQPSSELV